MKTDKDILKDGVVSNFIQKTPSLDFTDLVMDKVKASTETKIVVAPLVSKKAWLVSLVIGGLIVLSSFGIEVQNVEMTSWSKIGFQLPQLSDFEVTLKLMIVVLSVFLSMTIVDVIYRKFKQHQFEY